MKKAMLRFLLLAATALVLSACALPPPALYKVHTGPDVGYVVVGIGAAPDSSYSQYLMSFRPTDDPEAHKYAGSVGKLAFYKTKTFAQKIDYANDRESGVVLVAPLAPGSYEVFDLSGFLITGVVDSRFSSRTPFSIPFTIKPGEVVYLGNYLAHGMKGRSLIGLSVPAGAVFAISNRFATDVSIARARDPKIPMKAVDATPSVKALANPFFISPQ